MTAAGAVALSVAVTAAGAVAFAVTVTAAGAVAFAVTVTAAGTVMFAVVVMVAVSVGIKGQFPFQQGFHCLVRVSGNAAVKLDSGLGQSVSRAAADAAADQRIHALFFQKAGQGSVSGFAGAYHRGGSDRSFLYFIDFKIFCVSKVLENLSVFIGCRNFFHFSFLLNNL